MKKNNKNLKGLSLSRDQSQSSELCVTETELFPSTRSGFIDLLEDKSDEFVFGSKINCQSLAWEFKCPLDWEQLAQTDFDDVRFCTLCEEKVYTAYSKAELKRLASQGSCVRVITKSPAGMLGVLVEPSFKEPALSPEGIYLIEAITELADQIETFKKRRGFYSVSKLKRLLGRLNRFEEQIQSGLRNEKTGLSEDCTNLSEEQKTVYQERAAQVMRYLSKRDKFQQMLQEAEEYITFRSLSI